MTTIPDCGGQKCLISLLQCSVALVASALDNSSTGLHAIVKANDKIAIIPSNKWNRHFAAIHDGSDVTNFIDNCISVCYEYLCVWCIIARD